MKEKKEYFLKEVFLPGLKEIRQRLSKGFSAAPLTSLERGRIELADFEILLKAFLTLFGDCSLKSFLLENFDLKDPEFIDRLIRILATPLTYQEKELVSKMPTPDQLTELFKAKQRGEKLREEIRKKTQEKIAQLRKQLGALEAELEKSFSEQIKEMGLKVPPSQISQLIKSSFEGISSSILEAPTANLTFKITEVFFRYNFPKTTAQKVSEKLSKIETFEKMIKVAKYAWERLSLSHRQEELSIPLAIALPPEVSKDKTLFSQIAQNLSQKTFGEREEFVTATKKEIAKVAPQFLKKINTEALAAALSPGPYYCPQVPPFAKSWQKKRIEKKLKDVVTEALKAGGVKHEEPVVERAIQRLSESISEEELYRISSLGGGQQKEAVVQMLEASLCRQGLSLPEEKKEILVKAVEKFLPDLTLFLSNKERITERLKEGLEKIEASPIGILANFLGIFSSKAKRAVLVGFFDGNGEKIGKLKEHYQALGVMAKEKAGFIKAFFGDIEEYEILSNKAKTLGKIAGLLWEMEKETKNQSFLSRSFIFTGNNLRKVTSFIGGKSFQPLEIFSEIKNIDFGRFFPHFPTSFSEALNKLTGVLLYQSFPGLFLKDPSGLPLFKFSMAGLRFSLRSFFAKAKSFFTQKIFGSEIIQGIPALGGKFLAKLGLGALLKIGLRLGARALGATLSAGVTFLIEGGLNLFRGTLNFLGGLFGVRREEGPFFAQDILLAGGAVLAIFFLTFLLPILSFSQIGTSFTTQPYLLQKQKTLGIEEEKIATPSATLQIKVGRPLDETLTPGP